MINAGSGGDCAGRSRRVYASVLELEAYLFSRAGNVGYAVKVEVEHFHRREDVVGFKHCGDTFTLELFEIILMMPKILSPYEPRQH